MADLTIHDLLSSGYTDEEARAILEAKAGRGPKFVYHEPTKGGAAVSKRLKDLAVGEWFSLTDDERNVQVMTNKRRGGRRLSVNIMTGTATYLASNLFADSIDDDEDFAARSARVECVDDLVEAQKKGE